MTHFEHAFFRPAADDKNLLSEIFSDSAAQEKNKSPVKDITFLIDGSVSMTNKLYADIIPSPFAVSLQGVLDLAAQLKQNIATVLWGAQKVTPLTITKNEFTKYRNGIYNAGNFAPAVDYMQTTAANSTKPQHFIIASDGACADFEKSLAKTRTLLQTEPATKIDFITMPRFKAVTNMELLGVLLQQEFPAQVRFKKTPQKTPLNAILNEIFHCPCATVNPLTPPKV